MPNNKKKTAFFLAALLPAVTLAIAGCATRAPGGAPLPRPAVSAPVVPDADSQLDIVDGVRELAKASAQQASALLSLRGGYDRYPRIHLVLPDEAKPVVSALKVYGLGRLADPVERDINRAAEITAGNSLPVLRALIDEMDLREPEKLLGGNSTAVTDWFCHSQPDLLRNAYRTELAKGLQAAGYYDSLKILVDRYNEIPVFSDIPGIDMEDAILTQALRGFCWRMGLQEAQMRDDPATRPNPVIDQLLNRPW